MGEGEALAGHGVLEGVSGVDHGEQSTAESRDCPWLRSAKACVIVYDPWMDAIAGLLDGPRARDAFLLRSSMDPPWSLRIEDEAPLTVVAVVRGEAWLVPDEDEATRLRRGDVAIVRGPDHNTV